MTVIDQDLSPLAVEAQRVRDIGALGRSDVLVRLFDFLLLCSLEGRAPKEIEIAQEVFGKTGTFDMVEDASVRVYIHRLRRKLEELYGSAAGPRLAIPRGEYRLVLTDQVIEPDETLVEPEPVLAPPPTQRWQTGRRFWLGLGALAAVNIAGWALWTTHLPADAFTPVENTSLWSPLPASNRMTFVVAGDYFIFGEAPDEMEVSRLVREFAINSREDLDRYLMENPDLAGRYVDLDLHYLPVSTAQALQALLPVADGAAKRGAGPVRLVTMSALTADRLKNSNIVYVGFLSGLGLLRDPLFDASGFAIGASYDELVDRKSGRHYVSDWQQVSNGGTPRRDYSYIASMPGPTGNRIIVIAGTRDAAVMQAAEVASDPKQLAEIAKRSGNADAFEALYEVRTIGNLNLDSALVVARPLKTKAAWQAEPPNRPAYPDQFQRGVPAAPPAR